MAPATQLSAYATRVPCPWSNASFARCHHPRVPSEPSQGSVLVTRGQITDDYSTAGGCQVSQSTTPHLQPANPLQPLTIYPSQQDAQQRQHRQRQQQHRHPQRAFRTTARYGNRAESLACALQLLPSQTAQMMQEYPALSNFNHGSLADKVAEIAGMLQLPPRQVSAVLVRKPRVLGASLQAIEARLDCLVQMFGSLQAVRQLVLQDPTWLSWSPKHLRKRMHNMERCLGTHQAELLQLLQQHPQLLDASRWLGHSLGLVQQLLQLAASREVAMCNPVVAGAGANAAACSSNIVQQQQQQPPTVQQQPVTGLYLQPQQYQDASGQQEHQQQQQEEAPQASPAIAFTAVRELALQHPQLLLVPPDQVRAHIATMQAQSGLPLREVAAAVVANPALLHMNCNSSSNSGCRTASNQGSQDGFASASFNNQRLSQQSAAGVAASLYTTEHLPEESGNHSLNNTSSSSNNNNSSSSSSSSKRGNFRPQPGSRIGLD